MVSTLVSTACVSSEQAALPDFVLVTIDTLRADHLGCYGYPRDTSPFIDSLAARGVVFDNAFSASATTVPAHASLFTALYPLQHSVRANGGKLPADFPVLAELLAAAGYETAAFVGAKAHFRSSGLERGFDYFDEPPGGLASTRDAGETATAFSQWLAGRTSRAPLFLWLHFYDPHSPYRPPKRYFEGGGEELLHHILEEHRLDLEFFSHRRDVVLGMMDDYDGEIRTVDAALEEIFELLDARHGDRESVWFITADHGEGLGNHDWIIHGKNIYNEQIRVPLIAYSSSGRFASRRVDRVVEHVDLLPTIFDLLGETVLDGAATQGTSFRQALETGDQVSGDAFAFSERRSFKKRENHKPDAGKAASSIAAMIRQNIRDNYEPGEKFSLQNGRYKYIYHSELEHELYDVDADPYETVNLIGSGVPEEEMLRKEIESRIRRLRKMAPEEDLVVDEEALEALKALGYLQ